MKTRMLLLVLCTFASGCEEADSTDIPTSATSTTYIAPANIINYVVTFTITDDFGSDCVADPGTEFTLHFQDQNTIRGIRSDRSFNVPTQRWTYRRTGITSGDIHIWWDNPEQGEIVFDVTFFKTSSSGLWTSEEWDQAGRRCSARHRAEGRFRF